jgi:hypothetical protein
MQSLRDFTDFDCLEVWLDPLCCSVPHSAKQAGLVAPTTCFEEHARSTLCDADLGSTLFGFAWADQRRSGHALAGILPRGKTNNSDS